MKNHPIEEAEREVKERIVNETIAAYSKRGLEEAKKLFIEAARKLNLLDD